VLKFETIERQRADKHAYPITEEQKLVNMVRRGDARETENMLQQFTTNLVNSSSKSYPILRTGVESLYNTLKRLCINEGVMSNEISAIKPDSFWFSIEHLEQDIRGFIERIACLLKGRIRPEHPIIAKAVDYMLEHYKQDITLGSLSKELTISPGYFSRLFKEELGTPFKNYLTGIRMFRAKELLLKGSLTVSEIASEVGYQDPNYFSEAFKKHEGMSPSEYRETNGIS